ncbi:MAG TPA: type II secretion system protein [Pyrinomonadaceae bacterium]|nr:type II secretion system protein [Pyrinomonadaceae bacterium]
MKNKRTPDDSSDQAGFSLMELLVVISLLIIVMGSVLLLLKDGIKLSAVTYEMTEAQESLRTAQEYINRDLMTAGDGLRNINNICLSSNFVNNYLTKNNTGSSCGTGLVNLPLIQSDNDLPGTTTVTGTNPLVKVRSNPAATDRITILQIDPSFTPITLPPNAIVPSGANISVSAADINKFNEGEIYFITSSAGATFGTITNKNTNSRNLIFAASDVFDLNKPGNGGPINIVSDKGTLPTTIMRMRMIHYFVNENGLLVRRVLGVGGGSGYVDSVIAEHVVNLQFRYFLNLFDDTGFVGQPVAQLSTEEEQAAVRQVEVTVTTETVHAVSNGQTQTVSSTTTTSVRNLQFREAL